jgi:hypothetical protein
MSTQKSAPSARREAGSNCTDNPGAALEHMFVGLVGGTPYLSGTEARATSRVLKAAWDRGCTV